jgi:hypothetical protein
MIGQGFFLRLTKSNIDNGMLLNFFIESIFVQEAFIPFFFLNLFAG